MRFPPRYSNSLENSFCVNTINYNSITQLNVPYTIIRLRRPKILRIYSFEFVNGSNKRIRNHRCSVYKFPYQTFALFWNCTVFFPTESNAARGGHFLITPNEVSNFPLLLSRGFSLLSFSSPLSIGLSICVTTGS